MKQASLSKFLNLISSVFQTTGPLKKYFFQVRCSFFLLDSRSRPLRIYSVKVKSGDSLVQILFNLTGNTSIASLHLYKYPRSCRLVHVQSKTLKSKILCGFNMQALDFCEHGNRTVSPDSNAINQMRNNVFLLNFLQTFSLAHPLNDLCTSRQHALFTR